MRNVSIITFNFYMKVRDRDDYEWRAVLLKSVSLETGMLINSFHLDTIEMVLSSKWDWEKSPEGDYNFYMYEGA